MIISNINTNNNFGAKIVGQLKDEILTKEHNLSSANKQTELDTFLSTVEKVEKILPELTVDIYSENNSFYQIQSKSGDFLQERGNDKYSNNYDYNNLIKGLTYIKENYVLK